MPFSGSQSTQARLGALVGRPYGSFVGKAEASSAGAGIVFDALAIDVILFGELNTTAVYVGVDKIWTPGAGGAFSPTNLPNLVQWFDPSDSSTVTLNGSNVFQLADKSGNNHHATQFSFGNQPLLDVAALNGFDAVSFDGSDEELDLPDPGGITGSQNRSLFLVFENDSISNNQAIISYGSASTGRSFHLVTRGSSNKLGIGTWNNDYNSTGLSPGTSPHVGAVILNGTALGDCTLYLDGLGEAASGGSNVNTSAVGSSKIGSTHGNDDMDGRIGEIILYSTALSAADRHKVEGYLAHKWGLQSILPGGHPYASSPP